MYATSAQRLFCYLLLLSHHISDMNHIFFSNAVYYDNSILLLTDGVKCHLCEVTQVNKRTPPLCKYPEAIEHLSA